MFYSCIITYLTVLLWYFFTVCVRPGFKRKVLCLRDDVFFVRVNNSDPQITLRSKPRRSTLDTRYATQ